MTGPRLCQVTTSCQPRPDLLLILQLVGQPIEAFIKSVAAGGTGRLDVPVTLAQRVKTEFVGDLSRVHCIGQILQTRASVTVTVNGVVKLLAFNAHICPSKYLVYFKTRSGSCYEQEQMANPCCPLSCQGPEDLSAK